MTVTTCPSGLLCGDPSGDELVLGAAEAVSAGVDVEEYLSARSRGLSHEQCLEFWQHDHQLMVACEALETGIAWREVMKVVQTTMALRSYVKLRATGDRHRVTMAMYRRGCVSFSDYLTLRDRGRSRRQARAVLCTGEAIGLYWESIGEGLSHRSALRAARARYRLNNRAARYNNPYW